MSGRYWDRTSERTSNIPQIVVIPIVVKISHDMEGIQKFGTKIQKPPKEAPKPWCPWSFSCM